MNGHEPCQGNEDCCDQGKREFHGNIRQKDLAHDKQKADDFVI